MTEPSDVSPEPLAVKKKSDADEKRSLRRRTFKFVAGFLVSVLLLLTGYESIKQTEANDRYLLLVAQSTKLLLSQVGYSCTMGDAQRFTGREIAVREALAGFERGERQLIQLPTASRPGEPLSAWEAWGYQAAVFRQTLEDARKTVRQLEESAGILKPRPTDASFWGGCKLWLADLGDHLRFHWARYAQGKSEADLGVTPELTAARMSLLELSARDRGPLVCFVLTAGCDRLLADAQRDLQKAQAANPGQQTPEIAALETRIQELREQVAKKREAIKAAREAKLEPPAPDGYQFNFVVIPDCGAIPSMAIFVAAVLAFPAAWWRRLAGILIGVPILYWVNAFRLAFLGVLGAWDSGGPIFKFAHEYIWQGIYIIFVVAIWIGWVEFLVRRRTAHD